MSADAPPWFELMLPDLDEPLRFYELESLKEWVESEMKAWSWLWSGQVEVGTLKPVEFSQVKVGFTNLLAALAEPFEANSPQYRHMRNILQQTFNPAQPNAVVPSRSETGVRILSIRDLQGPDAARWAFKFHVRKTVLGQVQNAADYPLYLAAVLHSEDIFADVNKTLKSERARYRAEVTKLENRVRELEKQRIEERDREHELHRKSVRRLLKKTQKVWDRGMTTMSGQATSAIANITETEDRYRHQMALMAPVEYWKGKARSHATWELLYAGLCLVYFVFAGGAIWQTAKGAIGFLQELEAAAGEGARQGAQTSAYIITAGALLGGTTLLFWLGRLLVKLFLSEHHLRAECSEKAIMTQSFLSMETNETNFGETDRAIVLASIFRSSPDGIVKDEGPSDLAGTAILAKLLAR